MKKGWRKRDGVCRCSCVKGHGRNQNKKGGHCGQATTRPLCSSAQRQLTSQGPGLSRTEAVDVLALLRGWADVQVLLLRLLSSSVRQPGQNCRLYPCKS